MREGQPRRMSNFINTTTSSYNNPYSSFVSNRGKNDPLRFMKRFGSDVQPPRNLGDSGNDDPLAALRRFRKDISPPRFSRSGQNIFRRNSSVGNNIYKMNTTGSDERNSAINAYLKIKNPYTIGSQLNIFNR